MTTPTQTSADQAQLRSVEADLDHTRAALDRAEKRAARAEHTLSLLAAMGRCDDLASTIEALGQRPLPAPQTEPRERERLAVDLLWEARGIVSRATYWDGTAEGEEPDPDIAKDAEALIKRIDPLLMSQRAPAPSPSSEPRDTSTNPRSSR